MEALTVCSAFRILNMNIIQKTSAQPISQVTAGTDQPPESSTKQRGKFQKGNLHAWQPGQSGNPAGRPKSTRLSDAYRRQLAEVDGSDPERRTYAQLIADHMVRLAAGLAGSGKSSAIAAREIADRTEGKPRQPTPFDVKGEALQILANFLGCSIDQLPPPTDKRFD